MTKYISQSIKNDILILWNGYTQRKRVVTVAKTSKTQIFLNETKDKFRLKDGGLVGGGDYWSSSISIPKEGEIEKIKKKIKEQALAQSINKFDFSQCTLEHLEVIRDAINSQILKK